MRPGGSDSVAQRPAEHTGAADDNGDIRVETEELVQERRRCRHLPVTLS